MSRKMVSYDEAAKMKRCYEEDLDDKRKEINEKNFEIKKLKDEILDNKSEIRALRERLAEKNSEIEDMEERLCFSEWNRSKIKEIHEKEMRGLKIRHDEEVKRIHEENQKIINNNAKFYEETIRDLQVKNQEQIIDTKEIIISDSNIPAEIHSPPELRYKAEKAKAKKYDKYFDAIVYIIEQDFEMSKEYEIKKSEFHKILNEKLGEAIGVVIKPRSQIKR